MSVTQKHRLFWCTFLVSIAWTLWTLPADGSWHTEVVQWEGRVGKYYSLALDSSDAPRITYYNSTEYGLYYAWRTGSTWMAERVDTSYMRGKHCCLAFDSNDRPGISYCDESVDIDSVEWGYAD